MRRFELIEGTASKFWEVEQSDTDLNIRWGRIGTAGQSQTKSFADAAKAATAMTKLVAEKSGKGYSEVGVTEGAAIGKTEAKPKAETAAEKTAMPSAPKAAATTTATATTTPTEGPAESIDSQADRVFEAVRALIEAGTLTAKDTLTAGGLKRQHGVSEQGAALAFKQLKATGMIHGWGASCTPVQDAQAIAKDVGKERAHSAPAAGAAASVSPEAQAPVSADTPPWLAAGTPVRLSNDMLREAFPSRRFPPQPFTEPVSVGAAWLPVRRKLDLNIDLTATDAALRDASQRMVERATQPLPEPDAEADTVLLSLALSTGNHHGNTDFSAVLVTYLVAQYGLPGTVDLLLGAQHIQMQSSYDRAASKHRYSFSATVTGPMGSTYYGPMGTGEQALRAHLSLATPEVWQDCRDRIEAGLPAVHPSRQPTLAMLLPDAPELSNTLVHALAATKSAPETMHWLQLTATDPDAVALAAKVRLSYSSGFWGSGAMTSTVVQERGVDAVSVLERGAATDNAGDALACIGTPEAVQALARAASSSKGALARLALAVDRWPMAAIPALSRLVAAGGKDANLVTPSLTRLLRAHGDALPALRPWLDAGAQAVIDRQLALLAGPTEVADASELPGVLAAPPWLAKVQKKATAALVLEPLALAPVEQWPDGEREKAMRLNSWEISRHADARKDVGKLLDELGFDTDKKPLVPFAKSAAAAVAAGNADALIAEWRAMVAERKKERYYWFTFRGSYSALLPAAVGVPFWNAVAAEAESDDIGLVLATHGLAVLPGLAAMVRSKPTENLKHALNFGASELALPAARAFAKLKTLRAEGREWLLKYPEHTACGLIAPALGKAGEARDCAGAALRLLLANGHEALLLDVAGRYGKPEVVDALRAVLDESPLDRFPTKRAKLPEFWQPRGWRRPTLKNGKALPDDALEHLGQMLTFPTNEEIYGGIAVVKDTCDANSLAEFAWDAFTAWLEAGGPSKEGWALTALGFFGNDDTARKLTPFIRAWPGESAHARAVTGLDVLAAIGSDVALMLLNGIAQKVKFKGLQDKAREKIGAIAEARGLSTEELEDRLAPDLGLDEQGTMRLDFGPRAFKVGFDETLKPYVRETADGVDGARLPDLPKPKKTDDPELSKEAVERFKLLKKDARTIASQQLLRLEVAMCARRRWTPEVFRMFLADHPLVRHIVQRLIWGVYEVQGETSYGGTLKACFRVAEDGSCTTAEDDAFDLPEGANIRIGVPHALELPAADAAAFGQVFADYELLQPFAQIGRDVYTLTDEEMKSLKLERWKDVKVPTGRVLGLANKGWRRGQAQDGGCIWYFTKPLGTERVIELSLDPGIIVGMVDEYPEQTLGQVQVGKPSAWGDMNDAETLDKLDAISASELIRDMEGLRA